MSGLDHLSYAERLSTLNAFSLEDMRTCADMSAMFKQEYINIYSWFKFVHSHVGGLSASGQTVMGGVTRGAGLRLFQKRPSKNSAACLFRFRTARQWNALPHSVLSKGSLSSFKIAVKNFISLKKLDEFVWQMAIL